MRCPFCKEETLQIKSVKEEIPFITIEATCNFCGATSRFEGTNRTILEELEKEEEKNLYNCPMQKEITKMKEELTELKDTHYKRQDWLRKAKKEAGYNDNISFDVVWQEALKGARCWKFFLRIASESDKNDPNMEGLQALIHTITKTVEHEIDK